MAKKRTWLTPEEPLRHPDHPRPVTRREFIRQGFMTGTAAVTGGSTLLTSLLLQSQQAHADVTTIGNDIVGWANDASCPVGLSGHGKIPFICFDLAGGANIAGSNVMVGGPGGQTDFLSTAGYNKLGIPSSRVPSLGNLTDNTLGLLFHTDSALLRGILTTYTAGSGFVNGFVIPAVSDNDTNINPHNPMYGIAKAGVMPNTNPPQPGYGAKGSLLSLIGSVASVSGGNSMAPTILIDPTLQPTKISKPSDDTGLINTGNLSKILSGTDVVNTMEAITRISHAAITNPNARGSKYYDATNGSLPKQLQDSLLCAYAKAADTANRFNDPTALDPTDTVIQSIFQPAGGLFNSSEYLKTASVMKLVVNGLAGAGTITMGGYDYHTGDRKTGDLRDLRAGLCIGACLQYAATVGVPIMIYVFSDGSLFSNGTIDPNGSIVDSSLSGVSLPTGKGVWTGDNSSTAAAFALVFDPRGAPGVATSNQIGNFQSSGSVNTTATTATNKIRITAARDVNSLVYTLLLNYMGLHGEQGMFEQNFPSHTLGATAGALDDLIALSPLNSIQKNPDGTSTIMQPKPVV